MNAPTISVALCTYNGAAYLAEQLQSLRNQTLSPTELVVSDDGSTDETPEIVEDFARGAPFLVRLIRQPVNLRVTQNFAAALTLCRGEIIALCDQDDVWLPDKLRACTDFLRSHPTCWMMFTDAIVTDVDLKPLASARLWEHVGLTPDLRARLTARATSLQTLIDPSFVTGATVLLRRELLRYALPIPAELPARMIHDGWLAVVAAAIGRLNSLDQPTMLYRQHAGQQAGLIRPETSPKSMQLPREKFAALAINNGKLHQALASRVAAEAVPGVLEEVRLRAAHFRRRAELPVNRLRRVGPVFAEWRQGTYRRFSRRPLFAAVRDIVL
jgi:glycosyltransferase involved in cell wall biosynthesis